MKLSRREALVASSLSFGSLSLRALITGLPVPLLLGKSDKTLAQTNSAKFVILSHARNGDPIGANAPGTYPDDLNNDAQGLSGIEHPEVEGFANPSTISLGGKNYQAAQPWSTLPQTLLDSSAFWHHSTRTNSHADFQIVMTLQGALRGPGGNDSDQFASFLAQENAEALGTVAKELMRIGGSEIKSNGINAPLLKPLALKDIFAKKVNHFDEMLALRDHFLDREYKKIKTLGTPAQRALFDRYAQSRTEAKKMSDTLGQEISDINGNNAINQAKTAVALIKLKVAPVTTLLMPFGADNHGDADLTNEVTQTRQSMAAISTLWESLQSQELADKVVFASFNVFGRTLLRNSTGGRDHNGDHHTMYVFGAGVKPGMIGGIKRRGKDFACMPINSKNGGTNNADIQPNDSLASVGKTLAKLAGISDERIKARIDSERSKVISAAIL